VAAREASGLALPSSGFDGPFARLSVTQSLTKHRGCVNSLEWSNDGTLLVSGSDDLHVALYDTNTWKRTGAPRAQAQCSCCTAKRHATGLALSGWQLA
jgi:WD40 repeat protein